ncbi:hypothetical protein [Bacillus sp. FJAT-27251]|uniref:dCTP deaminase domain-containing protein n=1 Tax=Bacillus sp. FJAT-27251 TaxID=1684142 RepID=UPI0006A7ADF5|nr:hypothetical protein [Bacillus sp. FJAT-27251]
MLSDVDIKKLLNKEVVVHPYKEENLTPLGYNLTPSDFVFSLSTEELINQEDGYYSIKPHDTVLVLTEESIWVSKRIAGTFHSKVGVVSSGFGHISTTLDPNWSGPLLISLNNPTKMTLKLAKNKTFITLIFYPLNTISQKDHDNNPSRTDILRLISDDMLRKDLSEKGKMFISKAHEIFTNENINKEFTAKVNEINQKSINPILKAIKASRKKYIINNFKYWILNILMYVGIGVLVWRSLMYIFNIGKPEIINKINLSIFIALLAAILTIPPVKKIVKEEIK